LQPVPLVGGSLSFCLFLLRVLYCAKHASACDDDDDDDKGALALDVVVVNDSPGPSSAFT